MHGTLFGREANHNRLFEIVLHLKSNIRQKGFWAALHPWHRQD